MTCVHIAVVIAPRPALSLSPATSGRCGRRIHRKVLTEVDKGRVVADSLTLPFLANKGPCRATFHGRYIVLTLPHFRSNHVYFIRKETSISARRSVSHFACRNSGALQKESLNPPSKWKVTCSLIRPVEPCSDQEALVTEQETHDRKVIFGRFGSAVSRVTSSRVNRSSGSRFSFRT